METQQQLLYTVAVVVIMTTLSDNKVYLFERHA